MDKLLSKLKRIFNIDNQLNRIEHRQNSLLKSLDDLKILQAKEVLYIISNRPPFKKISELEFKVFSQWGDDGIIQYLVNHLQIASQTFIEFGVENYKEATTRFLLINNNWRGLIFDGLAENIDSIQGDSIYHQYDLTARCAFITAENINELISSAGFSGELGLLHIDIDGNDYWVWQALNVVNPIIVIMEYNAVLGSERSITVPYNPGFNRTVAHYSNLYFGVSLPALCFLANQKGYAFIGCTSNGNNAYFIRRDKLGNLPEKSPQEGFVTSRFRESRDKAGNLTFLSGENRLAAIQGLPVINVLNNQQEYL